MLVRAYELMTIFEGEVEQTSIDGILTKIEDMVKAGDGTITSTDNWGKRRFAYEIDHKWEGTYVVHEIVTEAADLADIERMLRLADDVVRHKLMRLPEHEGRKRGMLEGGETPVDTATPSEPTTPAEPAEEVADEAVVEAAG
ncbi:MAG: 30S ribosomal protein S6 [Acidimicrobiales bacterium]